MTLRPYQREFVDMTLAGLLEHDKVLSVMATGGGKTCCAGELIRRTPGRCLFLADARQLVHQAADKLSHWAAQPAAVEMAESRAPDDATLVVATTQSLARRLTTYSRGAFDLIIIDEAHRNTLGGQAQSVLDHFCSAQVVGITATPFRSDKRELGHYYETIATEIGLVRLITEGFLSRIVIKSVPVGISLEGVRTAAGDYREDDLGRAVEPHLFRCAETLADNAPRRRAVVFLPLVETSKKFVDACNSIGLRAVHVDGTDRDGIESFARGDHDVIACAQLLSTGWDQPDVDCVMILRPTKSLVLYSQMVGRGTRIADGKENLLLLDPLFLSDNLSLVRPARLIAGTDSEAVDLQDQLDSAEQLDLLEAEEQANVVRRRKLAEQLAEKAKRKARTVDAVEFALAIQDAALADYEPETDWDAKEPTPKQVECLKRAGIEGISCRGHASRVIDIMFARRSMSLATPKQLRWLIRMGCPEPHTVTFEQASAFLDRKFNKGRKEKVEA